MSHYRKTEIKPVPICGATHKRIFKSPESAQEFLDTHPGALKRFYRCWNCGGYHLTSQPFDPDRRKPLTDNG